MDPYLNVMDDFKTNLMWLSVFVPSVDGVGLRLKVNYRQVLQTNYFQPDKRTRITIEDAVYTPDGDTFQNSPLKLVFFAGFPKKITKKDKSKDSLKLTSISTVDVDAGKAQLPGGGEYSNMTLSLEGIHCIWPREQDLRDFLYLLGYHPYRNLGVDKHHFPWNSILGLFNDKDMKDPDVLLRMLREMSLDFLYYKHHDVFWNLTHFKGFIRFMTPIFISAIEGDHRIELANRLLYGIALKEEVPFMNSYDPNIDSAASEPKWARLLSSQFRELPFNSTVHKPISAEVYLPAKNSSDVCIAVITHLKSLSRKTAEQKTLYIRDSWRSLYSSIFSALENNDDFGTVLFETQEELYQHVLNPRQAEDCIARKNREILSIVMADVIFANNPTASLATANKPKPAIIGDWKPGLDNMTWTVMDNCPFTAVREIRVGSIFVFFTKYIFQIFFVIPSLFS
jgi:hypothetical protein